VGVALPRRTALGRAVQPVLRLAKRLVGAVEIPVGQQVQVALSDVPLLRLRLANGPNHKNDQKSKKQFQEN